MKESVLLTGGAGFLGRQIIKQVQDKGYNIIAPRSTELNLESDNGIDKFLEKNKSIVDTIKYIIHSAAYYGGLGINIEDPVGLIDKNSRMSVNIFKACKYLKLNKIVSVGSACSYPGNISDDLKEKDLFNGRCHNSVEAYGFSKRLQLVLQSAYYKQYKITSNQIILTNLYGEYDVFNEYRGHALPTFIKKIVDAKIYKKNVEVWGDGTPIRQFLYVKDAAKIIVESLSFDHDLEPINVGGEEISIKNLLEKICDIVDVKKDLIKWDSMKPNGVHRKVLNWDKLKLLYPDFKPIDLEEGLKHTIEWYRNNKEEADNRL